MDRDTIQILRDIRDERLERESKDGHKHFYICDACGQAVDTRNLAEVFYHEKPHHGPMDGQDGRPFPRPSAKIIPFPVKPRVPPGD